MEDELVSLRDKLQSERQELVGKLKEIDDDLASIERVLNLVSQQVPRRNDRQLDLLPAEQTSRRFAKISFDEALSTLFKENPRKFWAPKEIAIALLKDGYPTKAKDFGAVVRTMLGLKRRKNEISATKIKQGWLYGPKDSA